MSLVRWNTATSLDGFVAGPNDAMDWIFAYDEPNPLVDEIIGSTGALLVGRNTFEAGRQPGQAEQATEPFGGAWSGPQFVLTHHPPASEPDPSVTFLSGDIAPAVATARAAAGGGNVLVVGGDVARQWLQAGLMDDIVILVAPILLGDGVRLSGSVPYASVPLELLSVTQAGQVINLHYRPAR
ncbi:MAG: dihydrofolate reductase family protein [Actinobacteria bacterium]|nr:dihydrofolate reductase family protein [Actinomycetota bacterium]